MSSILRTQARAAGRWTRKDPRRYAAVRMRAVEREELASKAGLLREGRRLPSFLPRTSVASVIAAMLSMAKGARGR